MARYFNVLPGKSRAAFVTYGNKYVRVLGFNGYVDIQDFDRRIDGAPRAGGRRRIDLALEAASKELRLSNPLSQKIVVLMTSGQHSPEKDSKAIKDAAEPLHSQGALTFVIAIGQEPSSYQLRPIVHFPEDILLVKNYDQLLQSSIQTARNILERSGKEYRYKYAKHTKLLYEHLTTHV